jgi:hypothetical protein
VSGSSSDSSNDEEGTAGRRVSARGKSKAAKAKDKKNKKKKAQKTPKGNKK